jgi:putative DNA primase/helicase
MRMNLEAIKGCAVGRWPGIITSLAPHLSPVVERGIKHGPCPLCGGKDRARRHNDFCETGGIICNQCRGGANGFSVLMWANDWTFKESLEAVSLYLGLTEGLVVPESSYWYEKLTERQPLKDWTTERQELERIWNEADKRTGKIREYFEYRGLSIPPPETLRLHPSLDYWHEGKCYGKFLCMVAMITRGSELVGIHRTFLDSHGPGKANVPKPKLSKKCAGSMTGGCIRLFELEPLKPLVLCEGIETGLAIHSYSGWPVWPCVSRTLLEKVHIPDNIKSVIIGTDRDQSGVGEKSADRLAQRLVSEGREVKISLPPMEIPVGKKGVDWLDFLTTEAACV